MGRRTRGGGTVVETECQLKTTLRNGFQLHPTAVVVLHECLQTPARRRRFAIFRTQTLAAAEVTKDIGLLI